MDPLSEPLPAVTDRHEYASELLGRAGTGIPVSGIISYCSSFALAKECIRQLVAAGHPHAALIAFNPIAATADDIADAYNSARNMLGGTSIEPSMIALSLRHPAQARAVFEQELRGLAATTLRDRGIPEDFVSVSAEASARMYVDWLTFLLVAYGDDAPDQAPWRTLYVSSSDHVGTQPVRAEIDAHLEVACGSADLLRVERSRRAVLSFLRRASCDTR
ncbi:hypothetical protein F5X71_27750 [Nocardia brasiliensis]|uniref:Uncharacterized protein n=1 Tax=Nocardia brasiliensis TaxID=37326 RepID=A0A6G9XXK7_NOCBR|nr:hypothetical protein [Nocardia brasiliensis]QIS05600.1 hypothetical protein F5X71_27750 [Nocardia brasiliensis]